MQTKPRFTIIAGRPVQLPQRESPIEAARRRYGKPFAHEAGTRHVHTQGASYWTVNRVRDLQAQNEAYRERKKCK